MIECKKFKSIGKGSLLGYADIYIEKWGLVIYGISLHMKDGKRWINFPAKEFKDEHGETKYMNHLRFEDKDPSKAKAMFEAFSKQVKEAIDRHCQTMPQETSVREEELPF
jgi:hypothetical protein|uniref:Uncharacterized protein n=1 Tax=uncultured Caudovirales phage TaxID=2100421 RepID=A0A6J5KWM3_9CAUD|nr:hypothetical protein UFOVP88_56 [uncultured Caudovirales phage]